MPATYCIEYAKSNRSTCKQCKVKIDKDTLRIGTSVLGDGDYMMTSWRHLACQKVPAALKGEPPSAIDGYTIVKPADHGLVAAWLAGDASTVSSAKRKADVATASAADTTPKKTKQSVHSSPGSAGTTTPPAEEASRRDEYTELFNRLSVEALKGCLRANEQLLKGNKGELVARCVDRKSYGALPRCPQCSIGRLQVTYPRELGHGGQGIFTCPGGYDDDHYVRCSFRSMSVDRPPWKVTDLELASPAKSTATKSTATKSTATKSKADVDAPSTPARSTAQVTAKSAAKSAPPPVGMPGDDD